jgi:hypothetical protein
MHAWLDGVAAEGYGHAPASLITGEEHTQPFPGDLTIKPRAFESRLDWGRYIDTLLTGDSATSLQANHGLWAWLTLVLFDQVCPPDGQGRRKVSHRARYIPTGSDFRTYYRHLLEGPWRIVRAHRDNPERTLVLLAGPLHSPGDIYEQLASRQELATSRTVLEVATSLYIDPQSRKRKRGSGGSGAGSPRRLADVLLQFDLTFDIYAMEPQGLLRMLPKEFDRFRPAT